MTPTEAASTLRALGWRCEPPEALVAPALAPESEAAVAPPEAPRVGEVWEADGGDRRTVAVVDRGSYVWFHAGVVRMAGNTLANWHAWVQRSGATLVPPVSDPQPAAEPPAPEVGQVWEAPDYIARTVANIDAWHVWYRLHGYPDRVHAAKQSLWHAWVRRSGARVVA